MLNKDTAGIICSGLCLIHCLSMPVLMTLGASGLSLSFLEKEWIHWAFLVPILLLISLSLPQGFNVHLNKVPLTLALSGCLILIAGLTVITSYGEWFIVMASMLIILAHYYNRKLLGLKKYDYKRV
ncbi:MerC domain-containing protein [Marinicella sp. W31]|uniref:MerC domain-containing protein n=1 Tax=Marinicella sp. W31 TaxID=3023713 RepID=UPI0037572ABB